MVLFIFFLYIFKFSSLAIGLPIMGWDPGPVCLTHATHPVIAALLLLGITKSKLVSLDNKKLDIH